MEAAFKRLISGQTRGSMAAIGRASLWILSWLYNAIARLRNLAFAVQLKRTHRAACPVISVGNLTTGGTGKTPVVAHIIKRLAEQNANPVLLSRGYKAVDGEVNDEKLMLDQLCPGLVHLQNPDRVTSAQVAVQKHGANVLVLDDGFQHRRLGRDLDIVLIDATCPWGHGFILPRGLLREPKSSLRRANLVCVTRCEQVDESVRDQITNEIRRICGPDMPIDYVRFPVTGLRNAIGDTRDISFLSGRSVTAFCGIGNPDAFQQTLQSCGIVPTRFVPFPDHHHYAQDELEKLQQYADASTVFVTTHKDLVKIGSTVFAPEHLWAVEISAEFQNEAENLIPLLDELTGNAT